VAVHDHAGGARLSVAAEALATELSVGDSVAVNGVCLTATSIEGGSFAADVMHETLRRTAAFGEPGAIVNVELPLRAGDRLGGHIVQGHVDGVGSVVAVEEDGFARRVRVEPEERGLLRYVVEKGSIAVNGVSLTVSAVDDHGFEVSLIPETLERTTFATAKVGSAVNLEVDVLAKHVERLVRATMTKSSVVASEARPNVS
jgi:riboflavin synthase